jgi:purine-binding chemotaxis protein CheW
MTSNAHPGSPAPGAQHLTFSVAGESYAVDVLHVREVVEVMPITRVPSLPAAVRGVVNLRGAVVPVVDLGVRLGGAPLALTKRSCIVVIEVDRAGEPMIVGLLVDAVDQVIELGPDSLEPVPPFGTRAGPDVLDGMAVLGGSFVLVLDTARVVAELLGGADARRVHADAGAP